MPGIPPAVMRGLLEGTGPLLSKISSLFRRGVVKTIEDRRTRQVISAVISAGEHRVDVPVHQPFGFNSHAPLDGAVTHVLQNSADPTDLVALMPSNPASMRMGGLREGESILYDSAGQKLHFQNGRVVAVDATEGMVINQKGQPLLTLSEQGHVFYGDLYVKGHIYADEDVTGGGVSLNEHAHDGVKKGEEDTGKPGGGNKPPEPEPPEELPPWRETEDTFIGKREGEAPSALSQGEERHVTLFSNIS